MSIFDKDNKLYQEVFVCELDKSIDETIVVVTNSVHHTWPEKGIEFDGANKVEAAQDLPTVVGPKSIPLGIKHRKNVELKSYIESNQRHVDQLQAEIKKVKKLTNRQKVLWANLFAPFDNE
ncbi:hypothetical protein GOBAR_AA02393 [Gossypium barbadense]|uniref:Uncharacterized protein n=1 Tax=Gossypium barbadense TaxID=3634 RepID=A0A2P5YRF3_GOSBA|nr:hypothetical protein GOBAR_AA02393 [Gossypium barbadense]